MLTSIVLFLTAQALAKTNAESFLSSAWKSTNVVLQEKNMKEFGGDPGISNPIDSMQLRLSYDDMRKNLDDTPDDHTRDFAQEVGLRISPKGFSEYKLLGKLNRQESTLEKLAYKTELALALELRYAALLEYAQAVDRRKNLKSLSDALRQEMSMVRAASRASSSDAQTVVKTRRDFEEAQQKLSEAESLVTKALLNLKSFDPDLKEERVLLSELPPPTDLLAIVNRLASEKPVNVKETAPVQIAKERAQQAKDSLAYSIARDEKLLDYIEVSAGREYDANAEKEKKIGVSIAINIPGFAGSDYSARSKRRELVKYEIEAHEIERAQGIAIESSRQALQRAVEFYNALASSSDVATEQRVKRLARRQDPLLAVTMEKISLERSLKVKDAAFIAYTAYLSYLKSANLLIDRPQVNYFSKDLSVISL